MLFLSLVWLVIRRTQEAAAIASGPSLSPAPVDAVQMAAPPAPQTVVVNGIPVEEFNKLKAELEAAKAENAAPKGVPPETQSLKDKVNYLESRLIEYEILQEEIGSLSQLKLENERIKQELMQMKARAFAAASPPSEVPAMITTPESKSPPPGEMESTKTSSSSLPPPPLVTPEMGVTPAMNSKEALAQGEAATEGLEGLLDEIDKLTAPANK